MFKNAVFLMTGPICKCQEEDLAWSASVDDSGPSLLIWCKTCFLRIFIPSGVFKANFCFETPYPGGIHLPEEPGKAPDRKKIDAAGKYSGRKVISIFEAKK